MIRCCFYVLLLLLASACRFNQDEEFLVFYSEFQQQVKEEPLMRAFLEKKVAFDSVLVLLEPTEVQRILHLAKGKIQALKSIDPDRLSPIRKSYYQDVQSFLSIVLKNMEVDQIHHRQISFYDPISYLSGYDYAPDSMQLIMDLQIVAANYQFAINHIQSIPKSEAEEGVEQGVKVFKWLGEKSILPSNKKEQVFYAKQLKRAKLKTKDFISFCNSQVFERNNTIDHH